MTDWNDITLGTVASFINGDRGKNYPRQEDRVEVGIPFVNAADLVEGELRTETAEKITTAAFDRLSSGKTIPGDLLFCLRGSPGRVARNSFGTAAIASSLVILRAKPKVDARYLYYQLRSESFQHRCAALNNGSAQPNVSARALSELTIPLPPLPEQRAIAGVLGSLDDKIEQNRRTAGKLEELARAVFRAWFVDFAPVHAKASGAKTFPGLPQPVFDALPTTFTPATDSPLGRIPEGWEVKTIGEVVTIKGGGTPSTKKPEFWDGGTHHWTTPKDLSNLNVPVLTDTARKITQAGVDKISSGLLPVGTVLLSSRAPVGYLAIAAVPVAINQGYIAMVCEGQLSPQFILRWAENSMDLIKGNASGTTFAEISKKNFRPLPVVVPPPAITQAFEQVTKPLFDLLVANIHESHKLAELRDYLLPRLLSGTVRVRGNNE